MRLHLLALFALLACSFATDANASHGLGVAPVPRIVLSPNVELAVSPHIFGDPAIPNFFEGTAHADGVPLDVTVASDPAAAAEHIAAQQRPNDAAMKSLGAKESAPAPVDNTTAMPVGNEWQALVLMLFPLILWGLRRVNASAASFVHAPWWGWASSAISGLVASFAPALDTGHVLTARAAAMLVVTFVMSKIAQSNPSAMAVGGTNTGLPAAQS